MTPPAPPVFHTHKNRPPHRAHSVASLACTRVLSMRMLAATHAEHSRLLSPSTASCIAWIAEHQRKEHTFHSFRTSQR